MALFEENNNFNLIFNETSIQVTRHSVGSDSIYRIVFLDKRRPLVITRAAKANFQRFWTSVPEGRLEEAEEIGELIEKHLKSK